MKGIFVTIVDILGVFVPGFLLLIGILLFPPLFLDSFIQININNTENKTTILCREFQNNTIIITSIIVIIFSYVLGFIIRLFSVRFMQFVTRFFWEDKLKERTEVMTKQVKKSLKNPQLCKTIEAEAKLHSNYELSEQAPYFHFAKRLIRSKNPNLWLEAERLEADVRFSAGIFIPLVLLIVDGVWFAIKYNNKAGVILTIFTFLIALIVLVTFPGRRIKEVVYGYYLALIVLEYPDKNSEKEKEKDTPLFTVL